MSGGRANMPERWVRAVALSDVHNACKVMLLAMALRVSDSGVLESRPAPQMARELGISVPRLNERLKEAKDAGLLDTLTRPAPGRTATYQVLLRPSGRFWGTELRRGTAPATMRGAAAHRALTSGLGDAPKVLLMLFVHLMNADGTVYGLRREDYAELLGRSESTIAAWVGKAAKAGLLVLVDGGTRQRKARYRMTTAEGVGQQYTIAATTTGEQYAETSTLSAAQKGQHLMSTGTLNARASKDKPRQRADNPARSGVLRRVDERERRSDGGSADRLTLLPRLTSQRADRRGDGSRRGA